MEGVIEHVSETPGALGLVPWDEGGAEGQGALCGRRVAPRPRLRRRRKLPLKPEGGTVPDPEKLRRMVVGGDIVLDRGQYTYMVTGMGIDFPLIDGYAAVTSRVPEQAPTRKPGSSTSSPPSAPGG